MAHPTGESKDGVLKLDFDRRLLVQFRGSVVTSDAGLLAYRELDDALGLSTIAGATLADARTGKNGRHALVGLLRQSVFGRLAGYEDVNDAERLRHDPAMRWIIGGRARSEGRQPRPLCRIPNGRGRHPATNVPGDFAADRRTTAAASACANMRCRWYGQISPAAAVRAVRDDGPRPRRHSLLRERGKIAKMHARSGVIRGIPVNTGSGRSCPVDGVDGRNPCSSIGM
jgi:Transposase DDE domain group 1